MKNSHEIAIIESNKAWLNATPRSTWEIMMKLFPGKLGRVRDIPEAAKEVTNILIEADYGTPSKDYSDHCNITWIETV